MLLLPTVIESGTVRNTSYLLCNRTLRQFWYLSLLKRGQWTSSLPAVIERETVRHPSYMLSLQGDIGTPLFFTIFEKGYSWKPLLPAIIERGTVGKMETLVTCYFWKGYSWKPLLPAVFERGTVRNPCYLLLLKGVQ